MAKTLAPGHINAVYDDGSVTFNAQTENEVHIFSVTLSHIVGGSGQLERDLLTSVEREMKRQGYQSLKVVSWNNQS